MGKKQIVMGFEPGGQAAGGQWEGLDVDKQVVDYIKENEYGGIMFWAINETGMSAINTGLNVNTIALYANEGCGSSVVNPTNPTNPNNPINPGGSTGSSGECEKFISGYWENWKGPI